MKLRSSLPIGLAGVLALGTLTASADYATTMSSLNPLGWWRLNEPTQPVVPTHPITNSSSLGATGNGLYYGVPRLGQPGAFGTDTAANFNGASQYAEIPYNAAWNPSGPFTVEFWANLTNASAGAKSGVQSRFVGGGLQHGYLFFVNNGNTKWQFRVYNGAAGVTATDVNGPDIQANLWYHVVGVYDGTEIRIYVNGVQSSPSVAGVYVPNTNAPLRIAAGTPEGAPTLFFPGLIDEVAIYPTALPADQIAANYDASVTNAAGYAAQILALNPSAYWRMNEPTVPPYIPYAATNYGSLGSAQNGTYIGGATSGVAGPVRGQFAGFEGNNNSVGLNGTSGYISIPGFNEETDTFTITGWIKRSGSQVNASPFILQRADGSPATGLVVDFGNRLGYVWNDDAGTYSYNPGPAFFIPDGLWTFAAVTIAPTEATIYMGSTNGLISATRPGAYSHGPHNFSNGPLQISRDGTSGTRLIRGNLDEIAIFNQTLDATAISNLFYSATPAIMNVVRTPANPVFEGVDVEYTAQAVSGAPMDYQWRKNGSPIGGNSPVFSLNNVTPADNGSYDVVVTSGALSVTSVVDVITVVAGPPVVLTDPESLTRYAGASATFSVVAGGTAPFSYQWYRGASPITDATNASYTIPTVSLGDAGNYFAQVTNPNGVTNSTAATLTVLALPNTYSPVVLQNQPESYWRLSETSGTTAFDYAGGRHGTFPAPTAVVTGVDGPRTPEIPGMETDNTAFLLDGVAGWVTVPALSWNTNTVTFTAWVKLNSYPADLSGVVFSRGSSASGMHINSSGEFRYEWNGGFWGVSSGITVPLNTWVFLALVVEPAQARLYMGDANGMFVAVNTAGHGVTALDDPLYLGRDRTDRPLIGAIDEVAIYKRALSPNDISALYATGFGVPLEISLTEGGYIEDTKPSGTPHHGQNLGTTWEASVTDFNDVTRTGVAKFATATPSQIVTAADPDFDSPVGTIMFWMKADAPIPGPGNEGAILFDRRTSAGTVLVLNDAGSIFVQCAAGANSFAAGYLPDNAWRHVAVTYDQSVSGGVEIFVDGQSLGSNPNTTEWSWPTDQPIEIGRSHDGYWKRYDGQMDDFRIYNRILSQPEIANASTGALVDEAALKVRYNFDNEGIGYTVNWTFGSLESSPVLGPAATWEPVPGANPPSFPILPTAPTMFFRAAY